jgi:hypothetical protein
VALASHLAEILITPDAPMRFPVKLQKIVHSP